MSESDAGADRADHVERLRRQWARELPSLDTEPMAVLGRAYRLANLLRPSVQATFERFGLDRGEFDVLAALRRAGTPFRLTPTELYTSLMIASGSLTHKLARLERAGLVRREPSAQDARSLAVVLTSEGRRRVEQAFCADMQDEARLLAGLDATERKQLASLLSKLNLAIEQQLGTARPGEPDGDTPAARPRRAVGSRRALEQADVSLSKSARARLIQRTKTARRR